MKPDREGLFPAMTRSGEETEIIGARIAKMLERGDTLLLYGGLGAGKTTLTRGIANALGFSRVTSPTFTIMQPYPCNMDDGAVIVYHFDCYRLANADELYDAGLDEYLDNPDSIAIIEWPENIHETLPRGCVSVLIKRMGGEADNRVIFLDFDGT